MQTSTTLDSVNTKIASHRSLCLSLFLSQRTPKHKRKRNKKNDRYSQSQSITGSDIIRPPLPAAIRDGGRPFLLLVVVFHIPGDALGVEIWSSNLLRGGGPKGRGGRRVWVRRLGEGRIWNGDGGTERIAVREGPDLRGMLRAEVRGRPPVVHSGDLHHRHRHELLRP